MEENSKSLENISASVTRYYDSLTNKQIAEDRDWGEFAARQIADKPSDQSAGLRPSAANLQATPILDYEDAAIRDFIARFGRQQNGDRQFLHKAHLRLKELLRPVYSLDELQPSSGTFRAGKGSCSQRMACLESVSRACGIPTRSRILLVSGRFWYPRFRLVRMFVPKSILLVWPQFFLEDEWVDFDELYGSAKELAERAVGAFSNSGKSIFDAVDHTPIDFLAKTCGPNCAPSPFDLSRFILSDEGFLDTRDEVFHRYGSILATFRGRMFELIYGGRASF